MTEQTGQRVLLGHTGGRNKDAWEIFKVRDEDRFEGPIPREAVVDRLFDFKAVMRPVFTHDASGKLRHVEGSQAIVNNRTDHVFKIAGPNYRIHQFDEWLLEGLDKILDTDEFGIGLAGIYEQGARAFVMIERPETIPSASGMQVRPQILAATSHDSRYATNFRATAEFVVCTNIIDFTRRKGNPAFFVRHSKYSSLKVDDARKVLDLLVTAGDQITSVVDNLADVTVTDEQWQEIVESLVPLKKKSPARTIARISNKRERLHQMWADDPRCAPWNGSALGAFQVFNCYRQHHAGSDSSRLKRNMTDILSTPTGTTDEAILATIAAVTRAPVLAMQP